LTVSLETHDSIDPGLASEWDVLADRVGAAPWVRPGWFDAWWDAFGSGTLSILAFRRAGDLTGVIPLERRHGGYLSLSNWHTPEFGLLAADGRAQELADAFLGLRPETVSLRFLDPQDPGFAACLEAARTAKYLVLSRPLERSPYIEIDGDWEAYERRRGRKLVGELRRRRRRLEEQGRLEFEVTDGRKGLDALLDEGFRVEAAGWKGARGSAIASQPSTRRFYAAIARWGAERGVLRLAFLRLDSRAFAFDFAFEEDGVHYLLKTGFDPEFGRYAPGMLLRHQMLSRAFSSGVRRYEFLGADESWKLEWADVARERLALQAFARSPRGLAAWAGWALGRPLVKRARALGRPLVKRVRARPRR
jgi:CelD/BcsL family acetyltransferase involved in cellulose biosynthesis